MARVKKTVAPSPPKQARARETFEKLLRSTGLLLKEVGVEKISTNLIAEHAALTPPAFYRYFSDKYDVLEALAKRLMDEQNKLILDLLSSMETTDFGVESLETLILETISLTEAFPGGPWVMRTIRAIPSLEHVRLESHKEMAEAWANFFWENMEGADKDTLYRQARLGIDIGYAAIELVFDEPDLDRQAIVHDVARAMTLVAPFLKPGS